MIFAATALLVLISAQAEGSYFARAWPLLGAALIVPAVCLMLLGSVVSRPILGAAAALAALGAVGLASVAWGGLPDQAWKTFDQFLLAGTALLVGALGASFDRRGSRVILAGVLAGTVAMAIELLYRLQAGTAPAGWFDGRIVEGPMRYHNAQAALFVLGIPLALWASTRTPLVARAAGGLATILLGGALLITQSRGGIVAVVLALAAQLIVARDLRLTAHAFLGGLITAVQVIPLRHVDAALVDRAHNTTSDFRSYAVYCVVGSVVFAGICALPATRRVTVGLAAACAVCAAAGLIAGAPHVGAIRPAVHRALNGQEPVNLPAGQTRLTSLSLTGRKHIWKVAVHAFKDKPVLGHGAGSFTAIFTRARTNKDLYVLQPHSLELEVLAELGIPGALALLAAVALLIAALARKGGLRIEHAAAAGVLAGLFSQASFDWTFSFPALTAATMLVAGAAAGRAGFVSRSGATSLGWSLAALVALGFFAGPYLSARDLAQAKTTTNASQAWTLLRHARAFDPWNADVVDLQGQLAEEAGRYRQAAGLFARAGELARTSWAEEYRRARALRGAKLIPQAKTACRRAQFLNPLEPLLQQGPCSFGGG